MAAFDEISGVGQGSRKLLEAAGVHTAEELALQDADVLESELRNANAMLSISKRSPGRDTVAKWIADARALLGDESPGYDLGSFPGGDTREVVAVNYEANPEVSEMLSRAPCAIPLPGRKLMEGGLGVADVPAGLLLSRYSGDLDVRVDDPASPKPGVPARRGSGILERIESPAQRHFAASSARPMVSPAADIQRIPTSRSGDPEDRVALIRAPREATNRGRSPESRHYVRGVLHPHPWSLRIGAVFTILLLLNLPLAVLAALLLMLSREFPAQFPWVSEWFLAFPLSLPVIGFGYLIWGMGGKCKICTQKLFVHKAALKHVKSHRLPGMGFVIPLCIHMLAFSWFRCSSCGTPVRLKK